jgi:membrane associated rhomboid family serine protease
MITIIIIIITVITSLMAFGNPNLMQQFMFNAFVIKSRKQWYRFFSSGLIHADFFHLIFNMYALYLFGSLVENFFLSYYGKTIGTVLYLFLYISALAISSIVDYKKYQNTPNYNALGASGAVSAVIFCCIILYPQQGIMIFPIPFFIPSYIFGPLYIAYSYYMSNRNMDNIGHNAHLFGALYGVIFIFIVWKDALSHFIEQIR